MKTDSKVYNVWTYLSDVIILNFLWIGITLFSCGILFGATTSAVYSVMLKMIDRNKNYYVFKDFFKAFKINFKISTIIYFILLLIGGLLYYNYIIATEFNQSILKIVFYIALFQYALVTLYIFAIIAKFKASIKQYFINSLLIANKHLLTTVLVLSGLLGTFFIIRYISSFLILVMIGFYFLSTSYHFSKVFMNYEKEVAKY